MIEHGIFLGSSRDGLGYPQNLLMKLANRHGFIAGSTGSGKTVTLQVLTEGFSRAGVPVFLTDVKGDLAGLAAQGDQNEAFRQRCQATGCVPGAYPGFPVAFWDIFATDGHPVRVPIAAMGPLLLSRLLNLTEAQDGILNIAFRLAQEAELDLIYMQDLRILLIWMGENTTRLALSYGAVGVASIGGILRRLLILENQGGDILFGPTAMDIAEMQKTDHRGFGHINILAADRLMQSPRLYATFLLWMLAELFERMPEAGDLAQPKFVFFFDEAHLLFKDAPKVLLDKVEQVVRLIRSKGVGVYFVTQNPSDIPPNILNQLGNRVLHSLRGFTPRDQKALRAAAESFRPNPNFETADAIRNVGTGEAVVSLLQDSGEPGIAERILVRPPTSQTGAIDIKLRREIMAATERPAAQAGLSHAPLSQTQMSQVLSQVLQSRNQTGFEQLGPSVSHPGPEIKSNDTRYEERHLQATGNNAERTLRRNVRAYSTHLGQRLVRRLIRYAGTST